ncbi:quinol dehydrogenase periplasmic component [Coriobacteriaceae bacterium CHKCI002]|nr:quinol dehydrogenase periplasmic component [Coriobacteriaceae bacterium CHKCI002]
MDNVTRRSFLGFAAATAACAGVGGVARVLAGEGGLLRPPGGQDEGALVAACVRCDRCRSACPTNAVGVAHVEDGLLQARTPVLDFHKGYCDFCGKCQEACPTSALKAFDPARDKLGVAIVQKDRCIAYFEGCVECERACPFGAISLDESKRPVVDAQSCNGCGLCENVCPALVYRSFSGGTRRGIVVVSPERYERLGTTVVDGESEVVA